MRTCKKCGETKSKTLFAKNKNCKENIEFTCRACTTKNATKWERLSTAARSDIYMRYKYGITFADYEAMRLTQNNLCAICNKPERIIDSRYNRPRALCIDHHHKSGTVRQLLCGPCNTALGSFKEDIAVLESAILYLRKHEIKD